MALSDALAALGLPERFGFSQPNHAAQSYDDPQAILSSFGVTGKRPEPGKMLALYTTRDVNSKGAATAVMPSADDNQFSIQMSHGVYLRAPHITSRDGFQHLVLDFRRDEADGKWQLSEIAYRKHEEQPVSQIAVTGANNRDINSIVSAAQAMVRKGVAMGPMDHATDLNSYGEKIALAAQRQIAAQPAPTSAADTTQPTRKPAMPGNAQAA